jgi:hypothetical protein
MGFAQDAGRNRVNFWTCSMKTGVDCIQKSRMKPRKCSIMETVQAVCKVYGLTLLIQVETLWRCGDGLFFEVPPLVSDALVTMLHPLLENMMQTMITSKFLAWEFLFHGWKSPDIAWGEILIEFCVWLGKGGSVEPC